ncbi:PfkB family carbohydrate kinase [Hyalangium sp.]|uniref:PfkB family carbohydrate kinase n=1 Tax=Hyalangium sp. TaxID=2028555 RepID=UPI002D2D68B5|nr:PfkB family carbohydrate kinase [Hyalangium sp.]HYI01865.1 PfkB family carbohydrate kinase [Hyalangium sp.]
MSLLVVGSVALDSVETPFGKKEEVLGGSATFFSTAASFFTPVQLVAVVGEDFPEAHVQFLRGRNIGLEGLTREKGRTFRWKGKYGFQLNEAQTLDTQLNVFQDFAPKLPESYRSAPYVFLGNIHPELQSQVLDQVQSPRLVAADTMNFWIQGSREALLKTLQRVNLLFVNDAEIRQLSGEHNIVKAARAVLSMGPTRVVVKRGEYGALLFERDHIFACPAFPLEDVFDPTGAGDTFAGGFMGTLATAAQFDPEVVRRAMVMGSVMASFTVERFSLDRLRDLSLPEIRKRFSEFKRLTHFEELAPLQG